MALLVALRLLVAAEQLYYQEAVERAVFTPAFQVAAQVVALQELTAVLAVKVVKVSGQQAVAVPQDILATAAQLRAPTRLAMQVLLVQGGAVVRVVQETSLVRVAVV
jgi:hypothetical protein